MITLHGYWRSTASYRVRIALNMLELDYHRVSVHLVKNGGEQHRPEYDGINPTHLVPTLVDGDLVLNQSLAIIEYLDERYGDHTLLSADPVVRAQMRGVAQEIACDIHPLNNLRVLQHLEHSAQFGGEEKAQWMSHWMLIGFKALEARLAGNEERFCFGDQPSIADICLVAQLYNARRFNVSLDDFDQLKSIERNCLALPAFELAQPQNQSDAG